MWVGSQAVTLKSIKPIIQKKMDINNKAPNQDLVIFLQRNPYHISVKMTKIPSPCPPSHQDRHSLIITPDQPLQRT